MKLLIDMNLSPEWVAVLQRKGWEVIHWSSIGEPTASDRTIFDWARANGYIIFTHDLDFGAILAASPAEGPSVIQVRSQDVTPHHMERIVDSALRQYRTLLEQGALVVVDEARLRVRVLPLRP